MGNQAGKVAPNERQTPVFQLNRGEDKMNRSAIGIGLLALTLQAQESTAAQQDAKSDENLEEVVVVGRAQKFYRVESAETATKTPTDFLSIPQAVTVLNHQLIEDLAATKITDLYRSISGVTEVAYAGVTLRGFRQEEEIKYDGVEGDPFAQFSIPQLFNIERVEVLKGPSSMLYGVAEPGGLINYVTKKPTRETRGNVTLIAGNYNNYGVSGEYSGPVTDGGGVRVRVGGFQLEKEPFRHGVTDKNTIIDTGIAFDLRDRTELTLQGTYTKQFGHGMRLRGVPTDAKGNWLAAYDWSFAEPTDIQSLEAKVGQARLRNETEGGFTTTATVRLIDSSYLNWYHESIAAVDTNADGVADTIRRQFRDQSRNYKAKSLTVDNFFNVDLFGMNHLVLFGGEYADLALFTNNRQTPFNVNSAVSSITYRNPVYGNVNLANINALLADDVRTNDDKRYGFFVQDQVKFSKYFEAVLGLRYDSFDERNTIVRTGADSQFKDSNVALRGGLIYRPTETVSTYVSYSEGFQPQSAQNQHATNGPFEPLTGVSYEAGVKTDFFGGAIRSSLAAYQITKENLLQPDPAAPTTRFIALGEVESRGIELDFTGDLTKNWVLMVTYSYNETEVTKSLPNNGSFSGGGFGVPTRGQFVNAPRNMAGVWTRYDFPGIKSSIAGGLYHVDDRVNFDLGKVPAYTIYDMSWQTDWRNLNFQLNVKNLLDKQYAVSGWSGGNFPGEPRTFVFQVSMEFGDSLKFN